MSIVIKSVSEHGTMEQPQRYIVSSNEKFINEFPERAIKSIYPDVRNYDSTGLNTKTVYVGINHNNDVLFEVDAASVNVFYFH